VNSFRAEVARPQAAEDAVSDAVLAAFRVRHRYDVPRPDARPWLFGILTREISPRRRISVGMVTEGGDREELIFDPVSTTA
jgi:DNA-directed RNA polymerase specialized sigma24 family protein